MSNIWDAMEGETAKAYSAFKIYLRLGHHRTHSQVSAELGHVAPTTVNDWSRKFKWMDRVRAFEEYEFQSIEGAQIALKANNQSQVLTDAYQDYNDMLSWWREQFTTLKDSGEPLEAKNVKMFIEARREIDNMGRRAANLPNVIGKLVEQEKAPELPKNIMLNIPGAIVPGHVVDDDYDTDGDHEDDDE